MESGIIAIAPSVAVTFALIALALALIAVLLRAARGQRILIRDLAELESRTIPVDLAAFRNLVDAEEERFLRSRLPAAEYRRVERDRMRAAAEYVRRTAHNAALLLHLGEAVRRQADPELAEAARQLVDSSLRLRINAFLTLAILYARMLVPGMPISPVQMVDTYAALTERALRLMRLQNPAYAARISAVM